ncbi:MAG: hypothetical protein KAJ62_08575 [Desulfobacteraceae bacterium]|nr:hypothetical protein [Desulfobacteraceae bacterium]
MKFIQILQVLILVFMVNIANAQNYPPPIDLGIQNIPQETPVWCWVAVAQQLILPLKGPHGTPPQCALVAMANKANPNFCCQNPFPQQCLVTGHLQQIQWLIARFGGKFSSIQPPANPMVVYNTLVSGRPIIMAVKSSPNSGHVVVIRGMQWVPTQFGIQPMLLINDPMSFFTQPIPFQNIAQYWQTAIVVN